MIVYRWTEICCIFQSQTLFKMGSSSFRRGVFHMLPLARNHIISFSLCMHPCVYIYFVCIYCITWTDERLPEIFVFKSFRTFDQANVDFNQIPRTIIYRFNNSSENDRRVIRKLYDPAKRILFASRQCTKIRCCTGLTSSPDSRIAIGLKSIVLTIGNWFHLTTEMQTRKIFLSAWTASTKSDV